MKNLLAGALLLGLARAASAQVAAWGQCGGQGWTGETTCIPGWSQCLPGSATTTSASSPISSTSPGTISASIPRATLTEITNFGSNPTGVRVWIYVPQNLAPNPPIVVGIHWCTGTANAFYTATGYGSLADQKGFIVIYPQTPNSDGCWDVHSTETLTHNAGGDSLGIVSAVRWTITNVNANASKVFATGSGSGAMRTNVLIGAYPDVFAAGSAVAGVPFACFEGTSRWSSECSTGNLIKTPQEWGDRVRAAYPGYTGVRPKMQFWHGTADEILNYNNFGEEVKQWTNVSGVSTTPTNTVANYPLSGWTRYDYGPNVMGISAAGVTHDIAYQSNLILGWFGL
ncbi:carbohydrate esterase family 1 protein [Serendipita vermifera MAFF 305830]|uniref:Carboxylic ester hydrolase n=1 Tax=Serendipita vermifera MAFF 305830 TaxID=933852 RepID=A0A0C3AX45_SERVB|nr:carbohydrate esterase family 1 protein [Serendipita vermifera MAFF 305830]